MIKKTIKKSLQELLWGVSLMLPTVVYGAVGTTPISQSVGDALGAFVASGNAPAVLNDINANLNALVNQQTRNRELYNLAPELNGALTQMSQLAFIQGMHRINHRFDEFAGNPLGQQASIVSGYAAGDEEESTVPVVATSIMPISPNTAIWMKLQGHWAKQKPREEFAGYDGDATGVEIGLESTFDKQNKVGVDISFLSLGIDPSDFSISEHDIDSYQVDLYANYDFDGLPIYLEGNLSTAYNQFHSRRHIVSGGAIRDSKSSYHGWQGGARAELGYMWGYEKIKITPVVGLTYVHSHFDSYRETSADSLNLQVKLDDTNLFRSTIGLRSVYQGGVYDEITVMPAVYVLWSHDFHRDEPDAEANFIAGGPVFELKGLKPCRDGLEAGFSITLYNGHGFNYSTNYHYESRHNFHSNSVSFRMRYEWT
jgi:outer membrane autotransporter protein